eukprot:GHVU01114213.1.p1 GENE.GHVU01114213.1~~GHVU01114213.1.p1  ORF type:complete len:225 (+),score=10.28 GHVU01114213.1:266-940(+)
MSLKCPAPNWTEWPGTRIGAIVVVCIGVLGFVAAMVAGYLGFKNKPSESPYSSQARLWAFIPYGRDSVRRTATSILVEKSRCCCSRKLSFATEAILEVRPVKWGCKRTVLDVVVALLGSFVFGLWLHFIPCIIWTCDWGPSDGEQIRGIIWLVGTAVCLCVLMGLSTTVVLTWRYHDEDGGDPKTHTFSIADGCAFAINAPTVTEQQATLLSIFQPDFVSQEAD